MEQLYLRESHPFVLEYTLKNINNFVFNKSIVESINKYKYIFKRNQGYIE